MHLHDLVSAAAAVKETRSRNEKIARLAAVLRAASPEEMRLAVSWLSGELPQGRIGVGWSALKQVFPQPPAPPSLTIAECDAVFTAVAEVSGAGANARRQQHLGGLFARGTAREQEFLLRLLGGELRQGALEGVMADAVADATGVPRAAVRRAELLSGDLPTVAAAARADGAAGLARFRVELFRPLRPMLAQTADDPASAVEQLGDTLVDWKIDGARVQVHRDGDRVEVYTRNLHRVTERVPELVTAARALPIRQGVFDGEVIAMRPDGMPHSFQTTMRRFLAKLDVETARAELPLTTFLFDVMHVDGEDLVDTPAGARAETLARIAPGLVIPRLHTNDPDAADAFLDQAIAAGHEGLMAKGAASAYEAGQRGASWLKIKPAHTLDLVILAAEWGSGRREGWLSNLHLGARDPATGGWVMLGKTFKGLTDAMLTWQTGELLAREIGREDHVVHVRPEIVAEIAFSDVQVSPRYEGGLALRLARVKRYRTDKSAAEADTIEAVRRIHAAELKVRKEKPVRSDVG